MCEKCIALEIVLFRVEPADEYEWKTPRVLIGAVDRAWVVVGKVAIGLGPLAQIVAKTSFRGGIEVDEHYLDLNLRRVFTFGLILGPKKIVLVNDRAAQHSFRSEDKIESLTDGGFPNTVAGYQ